MEKSMSEQSGPVTFLRFVPQSLRSWRSAGIVLPFAVLFIVLSISSSSFLNTTNLINILDQQSAILIIAAAGTLVLVTGGIDLSVSRACTGSASSRASEISSGLEIGPQPEAWGGGIPPEHPGAFPATLIGKGKERAGSAGGVGGFRKGRFCGQALQATAGLDAYIGSSRPTERLGVCA